MTPEALHGFLRAGVFIALVSLVLVLGVPRDSAEFVVSVCSLTVGVTLVGLITLLIRLAQR